MGDIIAFTSGLNQALPGWFVETSIDLDAGDIAGAFIGSVRIANVPFLVATTVAEPSSPMLLGTGITAVLAMCRRHAGGHGASAGA